METAAAWVALYGDWSGRRVPKAPSAPWKAVWEELQRPGGSAYRLRGMGQWEASASIEDDHLMEESLRVLDEREVSGWRVLLPSEMPLDLTALGSQAPPLLWARGNVEFLQGECAAVVGSRQLMPEEASFAKTVGRWCAQRGLGLISGGAQGADRFAAEECIAFGGNVAHFLPGGESEKGGATILCRDPEAAEFNRLEALRRNRWIYASASMAVVIASRNGKGGSWSGAMVSRREKLAPVAVFIGKHPGDGNAALARLGFASVSSETDLDAFRAFALASKQQPLEFVEEQSRRPIAG